MRTRLESDTGFYRRGRPSASGLDPEAVHVAVGPFTILVSLGGLVVLAVTNPGGSGAAELGGLVIEFSLFTLVFFVSVMVHRLEDRDER